MAGPLSPAGTTLAWMHSVNADRSVRIAWVADAQAMGRVQADAWRDASTSVLGTADLGDLDAASIAAQWAASIRRPPLASYRALVALEGNEVVGLAATGPSEDPDAEDGADAEMSVLLVAPAARGQGHGSRLLAAVADTARADGFTRLTAWVLVGDDAVRGLLTSAGWATDGAHREVAATEDSPTTARQVRLHTSLEDA